MQCERTEIGVGYFGTREVEVTSQFRLYIEYKEFQDDQKQTKRKGHTDLDNAGRIIRQNIILFSIRKEFGQLVRKQSRRLQRHKIRPFHNYGKEECVVR